MLPFSNCRFIIVQLSNGYTIQKEYDGSYVFHINIPLQIDIKHVRFSFIPTDNNKPISLSEIEILENKIGSEFSNLSFKKYSGTIRRDSRLTQLASFVYRVWRFVMLKVYK